MQNRRDMMAGVLLLLVGVAVILWAIRLQVGTLLRPLPGFFPLLVGSGIAVMSIILFIQGRRGRTKAPQAYGDWQRPSIMVAGLAIYAAVLAPVGYILSTIFISLVTLRILGVKSWKVIGLSSVVLSVTVYFLFTQLLDVELPAGVFSFLGRD